MIKSYLVLFVACRGILQILSAYTRAMGRFSDAVWCDLIITDRMVGCFPNLTQYIEPNAGTSVIVGNYTATSLSDLLNRERRKYYVVFRFPFFGVRKWAACAYMDSRWKM